MKDKSLGIFLMALFGISGMSILLLAWLWPMPASERVLTAFIGSVGLVVALSRVRWLKSPQGRAGADEVMIKVAIEDKS